MEILKNLDQLYGRFQQFFRLSTDNLFRESNFVFDIASPESIAQIASEIEDKTFEKQDVENLFLLVFQLNEYTAVICNLTHLFLVAKKYDETYTLVNKIFVPHIGNKHYYSSKSTLFSERNFDRLVEIVKTANISNLHFIPFLIEIYKCESNKIYAKWKKPALEYLQSFFSENEKWLMEFVADNPDLRYKTYGAILDFNTTKGVEYLVKDFFTGENCDKEQNTALLKNYKRDVLYFIDTELPKVDTVKQSQMVEILLAMDADSEVMARIQDLYSNTKDEYIKELISNKLGISETMNIRTEKQFLYAVKRKIKEPQERTLGLPFDKLNLKLSSGIDADNAVYTLIIYLFKEEKNLNNLQKLKIMENIFDRESLQKTVEKLFDNLVSKGDILQAKWTIRMYALLSSVSSLPKIFEFLALILRQSRNREAKYLILCLIYSKKIEVLDFLKLQIEENNLFIKDNLEEFISIISNCVGMHEEDIKDMLVPNEFSIGEFDIQRDRLYSAYIAGKMYPITLFKKLFIENQIYNKLAQGLVFGEYRFNRLYNAFVIKGTEIQFIIGRTIFEKDYEKDADIVIGIIHPLDCDFKFEKIFTYFAEPTFQQFKKARFNSADYPLSSTTVNRFVGVVINTKPFEQYLTESGFRPNKTEEETEYKSLVHLFPPLNLLCEVQFEKVVTEKTTFNSLSNITFYKLSETMTAQNKFIMQKSNALAISSLPYRYFNNILTNVYEASKM